MALKAGIVGLPNVGKSTLFNCLSSAKAQAANFPFCTIDAQMGQITVPDERLNKLAELVHPGRIVPATCDIVDIAGLVKGASKGEGLGNQFLGNIRETDAIIHVLRCFDNDNIVHVDGSVDPVRDKEIIDTELQLKDLETVESRLKRVEKVAKVGGDKQAKVEYDVLMQYKAALEQGKSARTVTFEGEEEQHAAKNLFLLTSKPVLYVCNVDDASAAGGNRYVDAVREAIKDENAELLIISAQTEADIAGALPLLAVPCILEEFVPFDSEASIVMVADGERVVSFPVGRNVHRDGILDLCIVPAEVDSGVLARMKAQSERFMRDCGYRGILAIEYFIKGGEIYFNEMAPRPHNSGHYTIEGATTNQFRELVRYLVGEPLQEPQPVAPTVMKNILGQDLEAAERIAAENLPGVYVHLYGKTENRPKRKMGHITFVGMDAARFEAEWAGRFVK